MTTINKPRRPFDERPQSTVISSSQPNGNLSKLSEITAQMNKIVRNNLKQLPQEDIAQLRLLHLKLGQFIEQVPSGTKTQAIASATTPLGRKRNREKPQTNVDEPSMQSNLPDEPQARKMVSASTQFFDMEAWPYYFRDVKTISEPPQLSNEIFSILNSPCPFWPDKKVGDTHMCVFVPQTVNKQPLTLSRLGELTKNGPNDIRYGDGYLGHSFANHPIERSYWILATTAGVQSRGNKTYADQQKILTKKAGATYQVSTLLEASVCMFMARACCRIQPFYRTSRLLHEEQLVFCQTQTEAGDPMALCFRQVGLLLVDLKKEEKDADCTVIAVRRF